MVDVHHAVLSGVRLAYELRGNPSATPLVLLHALGQDRRSWAPVAGRFAEQFRVVAVDLRGHGESDWPGTYSFQLMADDVLHLLDHLQLKRVTLVGHSMGGVVAYMLAEQRSDRIERLIVEDAPPPFTRDWPVRGRPVGELDFDWDVVPAIVGEVNRGSPALWDGLNSISASTLLVGGGPDSHIPQEKLQAVAERIRDCVLVTIPTGHHVHATRPAAFADAVFSWLARTPSA